MTGRRDEGSEPGWETGGDAGRPAPAGGRMRRRTAWTPALGADYHLGGVGFLLVWDPDRQATLLLHTVDFQAWTELSAFPAVPKPDD